MLTHYERGWGWFVTDTCSATGWRYEKNMKTDNFRNWNLFSTQLIKHFSCGIAAGIGSAPRLQWHDFAKTKQVTTPKGQIYGCQKLSIKHTKTQFIDLPFGKRDRHRAVKSERRPTLPYPPIMKCNTSETVHKTGFWFMLDWNLIWKASKFNQAILLSQQCFQAVLIETGADCGTGFKRLQLRFDADSEPSNSSNRTKKLQSSCGRSEIRG